jgi:hypothetical protein
MSYGTPTRAGDAEYSGSLTAYMSGQMSGATISLEFGLKLNGVANLPEDPEGLCDPNFQSLVDYLADWPGFTLPQETEYDTIDPTQLIASKKYRSAEEVSVTP